MLGLVRTCYASLGQVARLGHVRTGLVGYSKLGQLRPGFARFGQVKQG
jgi:hypothetical protein